MSGSAQPSGGIREDRREVELRMEHVTSEINSARDSGTIPRGKKKSASFESRRRRRRLTGHKSCRVGLLGPHADQAEQIIKPRVNPKWIEPRVAPSPAGQGQ